MEKDSHQPESLATVTIKPDYAPSESGFSTEPPPAYHKPHSSAVQVAKIISFTVIAVTVILGCFMLASAYVSATASCRELEQEMELLAAASAADRFQPLQPEALVQDESQALAAKQQQQQEIKEEKPKKVLEDMVDNKIEENQKSDEDSSSSEEDDKIIHIKMPLELDFDDLANSVMEKNQKSKLNCIVERKRAEQVVDHQPKTIQLPFGLNLTTDPKFEHISGERMAILCESGHEVSNNDNNNEKENEENDDNEEETIMIQPIMIPIPHTNFQTHMPMQVQQVQQLPMVNRLPMPIPQQQQQQQPIHQIQAIHPMETMRPPMPIQSFPMEPPQQPPHFQPQQAQQPQQTPAFPPTQVLQHIAQQIIAQRLQMEAAAVARQQQQQQQQEEESNENMQDDEQQENAQQDGYSPMDYIVPHRMSIPEQILTQINRLPNKDVIVAFSSQQDDDDQSGQSQSVENQVVQQQRTSASEMNGRQAYARHIPMDIPMRIVPVEPQQQEGNQAGSNEEMRPHFVHPRSVRSVDNVLKPAKRVKRCSCDCAC